MGSENFELSLLTSVLVVCREFPRVVIVERVTRRIEEFVDYSQKLLFTEACGISLWLAKRVCARRGRTRVLCDIDWGLRKAGEAGLLNVVKWLCEMGEKEFGYRVSDFVTKDEQFLGLRSLMAVAAERGHVAIMKWILEQGVNVETTSFGGLTDLHLAACNGQSCIIQLLMDQGAQVNSKDDKGRTALHCAASAGYLSTLQQLVGRGAYINEKDLEGQTALHVASGVLVGNSLMVQFLVNNGALPFDQDRAGHTAFYRAMVVSNFEVLKFFLKKCCEEDKPPSRDQLVILFAAARSNQHYIIELLVDEFDVDISFVSRRGTTALHEAITSDAGAFHAVKVLLDRGADANKPDHFGITPMMKACRRCGLDILHLLLMHGGDVHNVDFAGRSALHYACENTPKKHAVFY